MEEIEEEINGGGTKPRNGMDVSQEKGLVTNKQELAGRRDWPPTLCTEAKKRRPFIYEAKVKIVLWWNDSGWSRYSVGLLLFLA